MAHSTDKAFRGRIFHFKEAATIESLDRNAEVFEDGILWVSQGKIHRIGKAKSVLRDLPRNVLVHHYRDCWIVPGFIDTHVHYPQLRIISSFGEELLSWLERHAYPEEEKFSRLPHAEKIARLFLEQLIRNGTTTALVFCTVHPQSVTAFFREAYRRNLRMIAGKTLMDRFCPSTLRDNAGSGYDDSKKLIEQWNGKGRLRYAVTPRFALTSSPSQLALAGKLLEEHSDVYLHTHIAENQDEIAKVRSLFPRRKSYLDVYDHFGLVTPRSLFAHGIYLSDHELKRLKEANSTIAFCPTSNLFLGSGLFNWAKAKKHKVKVGLGTDVGGGTSLSLLQTMAEAYKVVKLQRGLMTPLESFYLSTLGGARALNLDGVIGNFAHGKEADFVVMNPQATQLLRERIATSGSTVDQLFALMMLGDDRLIQATYILGELAHKKN